MSFNKNAVSAYVKQNEKELIAKSILLGKTVDLVSFQPNVKGSAKLNNLVDNVTLQDGSACGWTPAGSTVLSQRELKTGMFKVNEALCEKDLVGTFAEWEVKMSIGKTTLPFEQVIVDAKVKGINEKVENLIWNGNTVVTGGTYLDLTNGLISIIEGENTVVNATISGKTLASNTIDAINAIVAGIPNEIIDSPELVIFAGYEIVRKYIAAYNASNQFAGTLMLDGTNMVVTIPNTNIKLVGTPGLNGKNKAYATYLSNIVVGSDLMGDTSKFLLWYSEDNSEFRFKSEFNIGVQVRFPSHIVKYIA